VPGLKVYVSNKLEMLARELACLLETPLSSPMTSEIIVVQSFGMERWLSLKLADFHGICANYRFPFPNAMVHEVFNLALPDVPDETVFDVDVMAWRIMKMLPDLIEVHGFEKLKYYIDNDTTGLKLYQLSSRLADTFDQYVIFRPDMVSIWEKGKHKYSKEDKDIEYWQSVLWKTLADGHEGEHRAALKQTFLKGLSSTGGANLPERISIFGISYLPPFHLEIFYALSRITEVNLFLMNPCKEFWGDICSEREIDRISIKHGGAGEEDLYLEKGNSLLASMGSQGRFFFDALQSMDNEEHEHFVDVSSKNMLGWIQGDILNLREGGDGGKNAVSHDDRSVQIHSCHSPMREIEALYDNLLAMFDEHDDLRPEDILIMAPDIEVYAPYIHAVFDVPRHTDAGYIPFSIADRTLKRQSNIVDVFELVLNLAGSRLGASKVLTLLESGPVRKKFGIEEEDLSLIQHWIEETNIRWGIDAGSRAEMGLPGFDENTWKAGRDRLLLGYAMKAGEENMFDGILAYDDIEGERSVMLGRFLEFISMLFHYVGLLERPRNLDAWSELLLEMLDNLFEADESSEPHLHQLRTTLKRLTELKKISGYDGVVGVDVMRACLSDYFGGIMDPGRFMASGMTFCSMLPMRSIPFKVICMLGMNHDAYPRQQKVIGFDLISRNPMKGDRSKRDDDLYLFLEAIISARDILYISYVGQSITDNTIIQPSVLVSELLDYIDKAFIIDDNLNVSDHVLTMHRLQAFSPEYFKPGGKYFSYSMENLVAAQSLLKEDKTPLIFIPAPLETPGDEWKTINVDTLCQFFRNPAEFLLRRRLGLVIEQTHLRVEDVEPFDPDALEEYGIRQDIVRKRMDGRDMKQLFSMIRASGQIPQGNVGACFFEDLLGKTNLFAKRVQKYTDGRDVMPMEADLLIKGFNITGHLKCYGKYRLVDYRHAKIKGIDRLRTWIQHLALNAICNDGEVESFYIGSDNMMSFRPVENSMDILTGLLDIYWEGLMMPLHFFPGTSWAYADKGKKKIDRSPADSMKKARSTWESTDYNKGEEDNIYYQICFNGLDPLDKAFETLALGIYGPLIENGREEKL